MSSDFYHKRLFEKKRVRGKRTRPKTFRIKESAIDYAKKNGLEKYTIEIKGKKYVIVKK